MIILGIFLCIIVAGFFAGVETGLLAANQLKIYTKREKGVLFARCAYFLLIKPERLLATTLIGNNLLIVTATILFRIIFHELKIFSWVLWAGSFVLTLILLIFSEIIPKSFFRNHADTITVRLAPILVFFYYFFLPIIVVFNFLIKVMLFMFRKHGFKKKIPTSREDLRLLLKLRSREFYIPIPEQKIIDDIFNFQDTMARVVMIPFNKIPVCQRNLSLSDVVTIAQQSGSRFIPIYEQRTDNIVGYIDVEDIFYTDLLEISDLLIDAVFYPETKRIPDLLLSMNQKKQNVVFLCDEYGVISGMVTANEIVADIVGFIPGEANDKDQYIKKLSKERFLVAGTTNIDDLYRETGIAIQKDVFDTVGGYLCDKLGEIPKAGTIYRDKNVVYNIIERDKRHITKIEIKKKQELDY